MKLSAWCTALALTGALLLPVSASAQQSGGPNAPAESFETTKARVLERINERMARLNEEKACVEKAKDDEALKNCKPKSPAFPFPGQNRPK